MFSSFAVDSGQEERPFHRLPKLSARAWPNPDDLEIVLALIANAKRPVFIGGHGVWWSKAEAKLEEVGQKLGIPIFNVPYHQKLFSSQNRPSSSASTVLMRRFNSIGLPI